MTESPMP